LKTDKRHSLILPQWLIGLLLFISSITPAVADGLKLQAFTANYSLHIAGLHVGHSKLLLNQSGDLWRWQTSTKPIGFYRLFSKKKPYSETQFLSGTGRHLIQNIVISDEGDNNLLETAHFNWQERQATILRKKVTSTATISADVYDYHSINWLVANMMNGEESELEVDFYNKGEIVRSNIKRIDNQSIEVNGKNISAWVYEQSTVNSKSSLRYYFNSSKPLVPLKIEKLKPGKKPAILLLQSVVWG
jgi:hypothetical protein|tara:strand:+ start:31463 stop:32200 length:738 start_codon:yes stop_codon:yes gene_type:complete